MINRGRQPERFLATILFTDIVGSTDMAAKLGDKEWRRLLAAHHAAVRGQLRKFGGREVDTAGDGFLCSFAQPAQAVLAADAIVADVARLGLQVRAGVHIGECEMIGRKIGGIAVHIAARVMGAAAPSQVLVSSTVRDLVAGSGLEFRDGGVHELKGVPGEWHLYELARQEPVATDSATQPAGATANVDTPAYWHRYAFLFGGGTVVLVGAVVIALIYGGFPQGQTPASVGAPGPDNVVTIDAASGKVVDVHGVPAAPVAIVLDDSAQRLWVASLDAGVVTDFGLGAQPQNRTTGRVGRPTDLAIGDGLIWVADAFDKTITLVDASSGEALRTVENVLARRIAYGLGSAWATDDISDRLIRLDRQSGDVAQPVDLGEGAFPRGVAIGDAAIWVGNQGSSTLARIDPQSATVAVAGIALRTIPEAVAAGTADVWIAGREGDVVLRVDPATNSVSQTITVGDQPISIAADGDTVWVGCAGTGEVWHLARDGTTLATIDVGGVPTDIAVGGGRVYVTVRGE